MQTCRVQSEGGGARTQFGPHVAPSVGMSTAICISTVLCFFFVALSLSPERVYDTVQCFCFKMWGIVGRLAHVVAEMGGKTSPVQNLTKIFTKSVPLALLLKGGKRFSSFVSRPTSY